MTITTAVRINYPISAPALLDHVTLTAGGDLATVLRESHKPGDDWYGEPRTTHGIRNLAAQGLRTLAWVTWSEGGLVEQPDANFPDYILPPALVELCIDNPYGGWGNSDEPTGRSVQANEILPAVVQFLDAAGVPRTAWCWEDETAGTWHPGTEDVRKLNTNEPREYWTPEGAQV